MSALFMISSFGAPLQMASAASTTLPQTASNWAYTGGNQFNWDYSPQTSIGVSNAANLQVGWILPVTQDPAIFNSLPGGQREGVQTSLLLINGVAYALTVFGEVMAIDASNGNVIWSTQIPWGPNSTKGLGLISTVLHLHQGAFTYTPALPGQQVWETNPTIWVRPNDQRVYAMNAQTGKFEMNVTVFNGETSIPGAGAGDEYSDNSPTVTIDHTRGIMMTGMISTSDSNAARCFIDGWNLNTNPPTKMWENFCSPPQRGGNLQLDPNWSTESVNNMSNAWVFIGYGNGNPGGTGGPSGVLNLKTLSPSVLNATLYNDWGQAIQSPACAAALGGKSPGGVGLGWGASFLVNEKTGLMYFGTNNKGPYDSGCTPGPDLWAAALLAINDTSGKFVWGFQGTAHDLWDNDCSWNQALVNETIGGVLTPVVLKTCKNGYLYSLNAATGQMYWSFTPPVKQVPRCPLCYLYTPLNATEMNMAFPNSNLTPPTPQYPPSLGECEKDFAYDPTTNVVIVAGQDIPQLDVYVPPNATNYGSTVGARDVGAKGTTGGNSQLSNSTVYGINAATGQELWSYYIASQGYRGGIAVSGGVVYLPSADGTMRLVNEQTGASIANRLIGGPLTTIPTIGQTATGTQIMLFPISVGTVQPNGLGFSVQVPGDIIEWQLGPSGSGSVSTTITGVSTVVTTVTASGSSSGVSSTEFYAVVGIAVVLLIATGFLAMRGRKPAS